MLSASANLRPIDSQRLLKSVEALKTPSVKPPEQTIQEVLSQLAEAQSQTDTFELSGKDIYARGNLAISAMEDLQYPFRDAAFDNARTDSTSHGALALEVSGRVSRHLGKNGSRLPKLVQLSRQAALSVFKSDQLLELLLKDDRLDSKSRGHLLSAKRALDSACHQSQEGASEANYSVSPNFKANIALGEVDALASFIASQPVESNVSRAATAGEHSVQALLASHMGSHLSVERALDLSAQTRRELVNAEASLRLALASLAG